MPPPNHNPLRSHLLVGVLALWLAPVRAQAQWVPGGIAVCRCAGGQDAPSAVADGQGGEFVVWRDERNGPTGSNPDVYAQRITAAGTISQDWPADGVGACTDPGAQYRSALAADGTGGAILVWEDGRNFHWDIYAIRLTGAGTVAPGWPENGVPVCGVPDDQNFPALAPDGIGGAIFAWEDYRDGDSFNMVGGQIYALRLDASGQIAEGWPADGVPVCATATSQYRPKVLADGEGGAIIAWHDEDIHAQRLTAAGAVAEGWPAGGVTLCSARGAQEHVSICSDGAGGAFVVWEDLRTYFGFGSRIPYYNIYGSHVSASGAIAAGWPADGLALCDAPGAQNPHSVAPDGSGGVVVAWADYRDFEGMIYALRVTGAGTPAPGWPENGRLVSTAAGYEFSPVVAPDGMGGLYVAFEEFDAATSFQWVRVQHMTGDGGIAPGWNQAGVLVAGSLEGQSSPTIVPSGFGAIVAWDDIRNLADGTGSDIYAQRFVGDGPVPVLVSLVEARADLDRVRLAWHGATNGSATVERRTQDSSWEGIASVLPDGNGLLRFEDRNVSSRQRYGYRLRFLADGVEVVGGETWVEVPGTFALALEGPRPNPSRDLFMVAITLPTGAPASLELLDLGGRRVLEREVGSRGPGRHVIPWEETGALPPGVYWMRLRQAGDAHAMRAVKVK